MINKEAERKGKTLKAVVRQLIEGWSSSKRERHLDEIEHDGLQD